MLFTMLLTALVFATSVFNESVDEVDVQFQQFQTMFYRNYAPNEEPIRRSIFVDNYRIIVAHNREADNGYHSYRLAVNEFADMTTNEFNEIYIGYRFEANGIKRNDTIRDTRALATSVDWRKKGKVTPVKNQGQLGSSSAFSAVAAIEAEKAISTGILVELSEQNIVDCAPNKGQPMDMAFKYVIDNKGIDTENCYKTTPDHKCNFKRQCVGANIADYADIGTDSESDLQSAVAEQGVISVAIDASQQTFQFYSSGVYSDSHCSRTALNHCMAVVGYGSDCAGADYWIVKNSWGATWGEEGYVMIARNKDNMCGIASMASYPTGVQ